MKFEKILGQMILSEVPREGHYGTLSKMSLALSKCLSKWIKVDKWNQLKNPSHKLKEKLFVYAFYESLQS